MGELRNNFSAGKMNRDIDERLLPVGEYREAHNIEVSTSEADDAGVVQTLLGNLKRENIITGDGTGQATVNIENTGATCVGSIAVPDRDKIYYLVANGVDGDNGNERLIAKDYILEYDTITQRIKYIFVDIYRVTNTVNAAVTNSTTFHISNNGASITSNQTGIRVGMEIAQGAIGQGSGVFVTDILYDATVGQWQITVNEPVTLTNALIRFYSERVLEFNHLKLVTGINVVDDYIYWTDNEHEPKKINIERSYRGTGGLNYLVGADNGGINSTTANPTNETFLGDTDFFHTRLVIPLYDAAGYEVVTNAEGNEAVFVGLEDVTVIRKAPTQPLELNMFRGPVDRVNPETGIENPTSGIATVNFISFSEALPIGTQVANVNISPAVDLRPNDILVFTLQGIYDEVTDDPIYPTVRARVVNTIVVDNDPTTVSNGPYTVEILSISSTLLDPVTGETAGAETYDVKLEQQDTLFNFKFPRFSYRYKYCDGEYSPFAPFSQVAFLPDDFDYHPKKGHNLGMKNMIRSLVLKGYHPSEDSIPQDVVEIDILYKETNDPTVYTVDTIRSTDDHPLWPDLENNPNSRGEIEITTDIVHTIVPSNQLLRPYDNVPIRALAQEITANRLVYGNYVQNYDIDKEPKLNFSILSEAKPTQNFPLPSVKTLRDYQLGVVFSDRYGRETPVLSSESSIRLQKKYSASRNRLQASIPDDYVIPNWAEYYTFYVKESSIEYYSMSMDRWYDAADGNVWLSFPSADRNKIDEESFLIMKKAHGTDEPVYDDTKYRVIAIESEAPDFIKTKREFLGTVGSLAPSGNGFPLIGYDTVEVDGGVFETVFGDQLYITQPNKLVLQVTHEDNRSRDYEVANIARIGDPSNIGTYKIKLVEPFEEDISFTSSGNTFATANDNVQIELTELIVKNLPEFDGRFFVKIYRHKGLDEYLSEFSSDTLQIVDSFAVGYINNNAYINAGTWATGDSVYGGGGLSNNSHHGLGYARAMPEEAYHGGIAMQWSDNNTPDVSQDASGRWYSHVRYPYNAYHPTEHYWGNPNDASDAANNIANPPSGEVTNESTRLFYQGESNIYDNVTSNAIFGINGVGDIETYRTSAYDFWLDTWGKNRFFIDAASAASWSGCRSRKPGTIFNPLDESAGFLNADDHEWYGPTDPEDGHNIFPDSTYMWADNDGWNPPGWNSAAGAGSAWSQNSDAEGHNANGETTGYGFPSRGIWGSHPQYSLMDLSWCSFPLGGLSVEDWDSPEAIGNASFSSQVNIRKLSDVALGDTSAGSSAAARAFIEQMTTPGTNFRFQNDPGGTIYTTKSFASSSNPANGQYAYDNTQWATNSDDGCWGIQNFHHKSVEGNDDNQKSWQPWNRRQRFTIRVFPKIGSGDFGYNPIHGTDPNLVTDGNDPNFRRALRHDNLGTPDVIEIVSDILVNSDTYTDNAAIWETEPKESVELDVYYQASGLIPIHLSDKTKEEYIPIGSTFEFNGFQFQQAEIGGAPVSTTDLIAVNTVHTVTSWTGNSINFTPALPTNLTAINNTTQNPNADLPFQNGSIITFAVRDHNLRTMIVAQNVNEGATSMLMHGGPDTVNTSQMLFSQKHVLAWNNCWCFGNGLESDRIRDDFNAPQMDNGVKVSATVSNDQLRQERRRFGLIWSGIYNAVAKVNETNQFIAAEPITKEINPSNGSIQALKTRDTRILLFCEDKVLRAPTNRNILFNADGNSQVVASNAVIGDINAYQGDFGISTNPESLATTPYKMYFTDVNRGKVLQVTSEGVTAISEKGMKDYFADYMAGYNQGGYQVQRALGSYDERKNEYNLTLTQKHTPLQLTPDNQVTVSYSERSQGWVSFKTFWTEGNNRNIRGVQNGVSLNNNYYTFSDGHIWQHHINPIRNNFYATQNVSDITFLFNQQPDVVKSFMTLNYEGSAARITNFDTVNDQYFFNNSTNDPTGDGTQQGTIEVDGVTDGEYYNIGDTTAGWYVDNLTTNLQTCGELEFKNKEGKYFAYPTGDTTTLNNLDTNEFSVQGIGLANITNADTDPSGAAVTITVQNSSTSTAGTNWDTTPD